MILNTIRESKHYIPYKRVITASCRAIEHRKKKFPSKPSTDTESLWSGRKTVVEKKIFHRAVSEKNGLFCFHTCEKRPKKAVFRDFSQFSALQSDSFDFLHTKPFVCLEKTNLLSGGTYLNSKGYSRYVIFVCKNGQIRERRALYHSKTWVNSEVFRAFKPPHVMTEYLTSSYKL